MESIITLANLAYSEIVLYIILHTWRGNSFYPSGISQPLQANSHIYTNIVLIFSTLEVLKEISKLLNCDN